MRENRLINPQRHYITTDGLEGANCRHRRFAFVDGVSQRTYTDEELEKIDPPPFEYEGKEYTAYEATQKQRQIERTVRKLKRERDAYKAAGLDDDARAVNVKIRRLSRKYKEFSAAAGLPEQKERMRTGFGVDITDTPMFSPLKDYDDEITVVGKFDEKQYVIETDKPIISGTRVHFEENLNNKPDRSNLTVDVAQDIINNNRLVLYQTDRQTLKFLSDDGYALLNISKQLITVVPEKLRNKYKNYIEDKNE